MTRTRGIPLIERFLERIGKTDCCWEWTAGKNGDGYGQISEGGRDGGRMLKAHRVAYELFVGQIPEGICVCHRCDNRLCVRPEHLFLGTSVDNRADCVTKGRQARGEHVARVKLTQDKVQEIRAQYQFGSREFNARALGRRYGVSHTDILAVVHGRAWRPTE